MTARQFVVAGLRYHVELRGPDDPVAPTLVLLHGFTGSGAGWGAHLERFAAAGLRVIAPDLPGHGATADLADPARYTMASTSADLAALLHYLDVPVGHAFLLGYSMGGRIALGTAIGTWGTEPRRAQKSTEGTEGSRIGSVIDRPGLFRGLILESASPGLADEAGRAARRASDEAMAQRIEREGIAAFVAYWEDLPLFATQRRLPAATRQALRTQRLQNRAEGLAQSLRGIGTGVQPAYHDRLAGLDLPVLLIAGELDTRFTAMAQAMAHSLPDAHLAIVPGVGHTVHLEAPDRFDNLVLAFMKRKVKEQHYGY